MRQSQLRPRTPTDDEPPPQPPEGGGGGGGPPIAAAAAPNAPDDQRAAAGGGEQGGAEGERWAADRLARLRKELQDLDGRPPAERRCVLRALQRELHPDKLPEELRVHARPLFHLVQREWEVDEATARAASKEEPRGQSKSSDAGAGAG